MTIADRNISKHLYTYITALFLLTLFLRIVLISYCNSNYGGIEQNVIYGIQRILLGQLLYQDPASGTYAIMQYTPLYYYFIAGLAKMIHIGGADVQSIYTLCRLMAIIFNLLTVVTIALVIRSATSLSWSQSYVFAMPVLILLTCHYYTRGDSLHLYLFTTAVYAYILYSKNGGVQSIMIAALFSAGCIMAKQSGILVVGIICCDLLFNERKYLAAFLYCLLTFGIAYLIALACIHGDWQAFYQNVYLGLKNGIETSFLYRIFISQYFSEMVPCYLLGGVVVWLAVRKITDRTFKLVAIGVALSFVFAVVTGLKAGSANNYFTEFLVFVTVAVPYVLQSEHATIKLFRLFSYRIDIRCFTYGALIILITSKTVGLFTAIYIEKSYKNYKDEYANEIALRQSLRKILDIQKGEYIFFTDRLFFDNLFIENAIMPTKDVVCQTYGADHTTFDYSGFVEGMNNGMIKYIITDKNKPDINEWNKYIPFILFDKDKFRLLTHYLGYSIYVYTSQS